MIKCACCGAIYDFVPRLKCCVSIQEDGQECGASVFVKSDATAAAEEELKRRAEGMRFDAGKLGVHLLPTRPLEAVARVLDFGARKYAANNWRKGMAYSRVYGPMIRHAWKWWRGEDFDTPDGMPFAQGEGGPLDANGKPIFSGEHHLACVACNALFLLEYCLSTHAERKGQDDRRENDAHIPT